MVYKYCENALVAIYAKDSAEFLPTVASVIAHSRKVGASLLHVRVGFRPGFPEVSERNRFLAKMKASPQHRQIFEGSSPVCHPQNYDRNEQDEAAR